MSEWAESSGTTFWGDADDTEALQRCRTLVNTIDDGIYQLDAEDRFVAVNNGIVELTGYAREELLDEHFSVLFDEEGVSTIERETERLHTNSTDRSELLDLTVQTAEGEQVRCEVRVNLLEADDAAGETVGTVRDITEQKHREQELRETREQLAVATEAASVGIWTWDIQENVVTADEHLAETYGMGSEEAAAGAPIEAFFEPMYEEDRERVWQQLDEAVEETGEFEAEFRVRGTDDDTTWVMSRAEVEYDDGEPIRMHGAISDITERKRREQLLAEQTELLERIASGAPLEECLSALCAAVPRLNPGVRASILLADDERESFEQSIAPNLSQSWDEGLEDAPINDLMIGTCGTAVFRGEPITCEDVANDDRWSKEWRDVCIDNGVLAGHSEPILDADGDPEGSFMLCFDEPREPNEWEQRLIDFGTHIASVALERDRSRQALQESEERLRSALEIDSVGVMFWGDDFTITEANDAFVRMSGYTHEELVGKRWQDLTPKEFQAPSERAVADVKATGSTEPYEKQYIRKDGSRWWGLFAPRRLSNGEVVEFVLDITERKRQERRARFLEELERKLQPLTDPDEIMATAARTLGERLNVDRCAYADVEDDEDHFVITGDYAPGDSKSIVGRWTFSAFGDDCLRLMRENEPYVVDDVDADERITAADREAYEQTQIESVICVPLHKDGQFTSAMAVHQRTPREWRPHEIDLVTTVVQRCWESLQRARTMRDLRESEKRLRLALESAEMGAWELDLRTEDSPFRSPQHDRIFGYEEPLDDWSVERFLDHVHPNDREWVEQSFEDALETGEWDLECRIVRSDGEQRWIAVQAEFYYDEGEPVRAVGTVQDVTEQKEQERQLRDAKSRLEAAAEAGAVGTWEWHIPDDTMVVGPSFAKKFGIDPEMAKEGVPLGRFVSAIHEGDRDKVERKIEEAIQSRGEYEAEYRVRNADDELRWVVARGHVECDEDGNPVMFPGALTDITQRKENQRKLERSERRYRTLAENFPNGAVAVYDDDLRYTLAQGSVLGDALPGRDQIEGRTVPEVYPQYIVEDLGPLLRTAVEDGETGDARFEFGGRHWRVWATPLRNAAGEIFAGLSFAQNVTEQVEREQRLEELIDDLETSNERLEQFAYAASHDLQEPLRMVSSYLRLIEQRYADALDEDGEEFLEFAVDGADRMRNMIDGLLKYSRVETRGDPFESVDLDAVLEDVREDLQVSIEDSGAEITTESLPRVEGDEGQLRQVFQNLLDNAIEYSGDEPPRVHVSAERSADKWIIAVSDEGIGVDPGDVDRIFEVFQSLHTPDDHSGMGIGLALCKRILERHGGEIWAESEPGEEATFTFTLPADSEHSE